MGRYASLIAAAAIAHVLIIEVLLIVLDPHLSRGFYQYDADLGFRVRSYVRSPTGDVSNRFGFNDRDYPLAKPPGVFRIVVVSDSFNWAGGRDGSYTALLARRFEKSLGHHGIEVINVGYPGTHTVEQLAMLKKYGLRYDPDLVVLGFSAGNDFFDAAPDRKRIVVNGRHLDIHKDKERRMFGYPIILRSRLWLLVEDRWRAFRASWDTRADAASRQRTFSEEVFLRIARARMEFFDIRRFREGRFQPNIDYIFQSIAEMDALLKARHCRFIVAIYPDEFQVDPRLARTIWDRFHLRGEDYDLELAQRVLERFLETANIPYIDVLPRFRTETKTRQLYLFRDTHLNAAGNELLADILFTELRARAGATAP